MQTLLDQDQILQISSLSVQIAYNDINVLHLNSFDVGFVATAQAGKLSGMLLVDHNHVALLRIIEFGEFLLGLNIGSTNQSVVGFLHRILTNIRLRDRITK